MKLSMVVPVVCGLATPAFAEDVRAPLAADLATYTKALGLKGPLEATISTSFGDLHCELFADQAPVAVANFIGLATGKKPYEKNGRVIKGKPYFDGLIFHRVIPNFMIQGGDPTGTGTGGPGYDFDDEPPAKGAEMSPGTLAMANAGTRDGHGTNGSQFFVMEGSAPYLVGRHTIFGRCKEVDIVTQITHAPRDARDRPETPVTMKIKIGSAKPAKLVKPPAPPKANEFKTPLKSR